ncbi:MAG TPA: hypothetical protein DCL77_14715 [Prolixibacteraceae bacterium]|jgi:hypothetical protein|nr:hypothetical protein [Prolixibacteraceae bacterium]
MCGLSPFFEFKPTSGVILLFSIEFNQTTGEVDLFFTILGQLQVWFTYFHPICLCHRYGGVAIFKTNQFLTKIQSKWIKRRISTVMESLLQISFPFQQADFSFINK